MRFYVLNDAYDPVSDAHETFKEAVATAVDLVAFRREVTTAFVVGQKSDIFRTDIPCPFYLRVIAQYDLDKI